MDAELAAKDPATFSMMFSSRAMRCICVGIPFMSFVTYGFGFWAPPYLLRVHGVDLVSAATFLGLSSAVGGWVGVTLGGVLADRLKHRSANARLYIAASVPVIALPVGVWFLYTDNLWIAYACNFVFSITSPMWIGPAASTVNDLVMPRMRAVTSAFYLLMVTFIGLALGPYTIGQVSDALFASGMSDGDALRQGMLVGLGGFFVAMTLVIVAMRYLPADEASRLERARAAGESV
ncbi:MAG: MFS transporter [Gammaproteobacteria bacterium]|nr:MFS transporter [Gammaproteobacteria bacterium]